MTYTEVPIKLTNVQKRKINSAIKNNTNVTLRLSKKNFDTDSEAKILLTNTQINKLSKTTNAADITLSKAQINKMKSGGFLGALLGGLAASLLPGLLSGGSVANNTTKGSGGSIPPERYKQYESASATGIKHSACLEPGDCYNKHSNGVAKTQSQGSGGVFLGQRPPKPTTTTGTSITKEGVTKGEGVFLKMQNHPGDRVYMKHGRNMYDISDIQVTDGKGIGTIIAKFLPKVLPILKGLGKSLLGGLAVGAASEGASQAIKAIAKKGSGLYLKRGGKIYDISEIVEEMAGEKMGAGLLSKIFGFKSPFKNIPLLGALI